MRKFRFIRRTCVLFKRDDADSVRGMRGSRCKKCGGELIPIAYGLPGEDMWNAAQRGEIRLGGCCVYPDMPTSACRECGTELRTRASRPSWEL